MPDDLSDLELIERYLKNDNKAFEVLYERYRKQLYSYLTRMLSGQHALVDDIFQKTWIKIIKTLPNYRHRERFMAYAARIAHNLAIDHFRKTKREALTENTETTTAFASPNSEPWREMDNEELAESLNRCIEKLNREQKEVFTLRQNGMSFKEIASLQECSINTALGRMQYAIKNLRLCLSDWKKH